MRPYDDPHERGTWPVPAPQHAHGAGYAPRYREPPPYEEDGPPERSGKELREYISMVKRRWFQILAVAILLLGVVTAFTLTLPAKYRSSATIRVQEQEIPPDLVRTTITSFADERIQVINQEIMTGSVLQELIDRYDLYANLRGRIVEAEIADRMRRDIQLTTVDANMSDRGSGRRTNATIAFKLSFDYTDPKAAQLVVTELVNLYLQENEKARRQSVAETAAFLGQESKRVAAQIREIEATLAEFKRRNAGRTPESSSVNLQLSERTDAEISRVDREISMLQDRRAAAEAQLAVMSPVLPSPALATPAGERVLTTADRLRLLEAQHATASASYGAEHPDVRRLQREIAVLKAQLGDGDEAHAKVDALERELAAARSRYSEDHPDVARLRRAVASAKAAAPPRDAVAAVRTPPPAAKPDNPAYITLTSQVESAKREITQLTALREDLKAKQRTYDVRLMQLPEVERQFRELTRDYDNAQTRYREIRAKESQAQVAQELERDRKAERFSVLEAATLPYSPVSPDRVRIALAGLIGSLGAGVGLAWLRELLDPSVKGPLELARIASVPILSAIPYIDTHRERVARRWRQWLGLLLALLVAGAFLAMVHFLYRPLPTLFDSVGRMVGG